MKRLKYLAFLVLLFPALATFAQGSGPEMADHLRSDGKFWVVVAVIALIFCGISIYLVLLDRRIGKMEKNQDLNQP